LYVLRKSDLEFEDLIKYHYIFTVRARLVNLHYKGTAIAGKVYEFSIVKIMDFDAV
jgi:hypothetical protein